MPRLSMRGWRWFAIGGLATVLVATGVIAHLRRPRGTPVMRGQRVARRLGCFACHGPGGTGGVPNPGSDEGEVPAWDGGVASMYVEGRDEIREWILYGEPRRLSDAEGHHHMDKALIAMPAYEGRLSGQELDDLCAFFEAVSDYGQRPPPKAEEGRRAASRLGCLGCHGPQGRGGSSNPGAFKSYIPPWDGGDFAELVRDDAELRQWILDGKIDRLESNPIARHFTHGQAIRMPAYRDRLGDGELDALVAYIRWLRGD